MKLKDFIKVLDTIEPIKVYLDGCEDEEYDKNDIPGWYMNLTLEDVFIDNEGIGVSIYTS